MLAYYSNIVGRENVGAESPCEISAESVLEAFRGMDSRSGFLGVQISERVWLQLMKERAGVRLEMLDTVARSLEFVEVEPAQVERLLEQFERAADLEGLVRGTFGAWNEMNLEQASTADSKAPRHPSFPHSARENVRFIATEAGVKDGIAGASNAKAGAPYHYVLFGKQTEPSPGVYFECDGQWGGGLDSVKEIEAGAGYIVFALKNGSIIEIQSDVEEASGWNLFVESARACFPAT